MKGIHCRMTFPPLGEKTKLLNKIRKLINSHRLLSNKILNNRLKKSF